MNKIKQRPIVLASGSPRRKELLTGLGLTFAIKASDVNEDIQGTYSPNEIVTLLAQRKAEAVAQEVEEGLVIGSDTIVVLDQEVLGKPGSEEDAFSMLSKLQGNVHTVFSGVVIIDVDTGNSRTGYQSTKVKLRLLDEKEIRKYISTREPLDKAGAYAIQGLGATLVESIEGDYFTVVGLPLALTAQYLREFGVDVLATAANKNFLVDD
jgi:septum formation protein